MYLTILSMGALLFRGIKAHEIFHILTKYRETWLLASINCF